ncbi:MAG: TonB-dependent receptor [Acidobacteria bacterium]|nr:TonB-dependent receptor [Acidobacteriota bacterium]
MRSMEYVFSCVVLFALSTLAAAQAGMGSIAGVVSDPSDAVVQGATVTAKNSATGAVRTATSAEGGNYTITSLPPGEYSVTVEKTGFSKLTFDHLTVSTSLVVPLNAQFRIGATTENVNVTVDTVAPIETEDSQVSNLVDSERMKALPLITRNPYELVLLSPGTSSASSSLGGFNVNGARERNNNFLLDGVDNNDTSVPGIPGGALAANPESTEEFRVITNNFNAEYGRDTGAIIDVVTKAGTNQFHGGAYWFGRYDKIGGARDWFNRAADGPRDPYVRNQFGYSIGGPIWKNKTFFFFNQEFQRFPTARTNAAQVPLQAFKDGLFTFNGIDDNGDPISRTIDLRQGSADNQTITANYELFNGSGVTSIPADPTMQKIFSLYPQAAFETGDGFSGVTFFPSSSNQRSYQATGKLDHHFTDSEYLSFRYSYNDLKDPNSGAASALPDNVGAASLKAIATGGVATLTSNLRPSLINNFSFGWNHIFAGFGCDGLNVLDSAFPVDQFGNGTDFATNPFTSVGCGGLLSDGQARKTGTISFGNTLTWVKGAHTLKFGGDFRNVKESGDNNFNSRRQPDTRIGTATGGGFDSAGIGVSDPALNDAIAAYYGFVVSDLQAQFFDKSGVRKGSDNKDFRQREGSVFVQDSWKVRPNITFNFGVRYQFNGVPYEVHNNLSNLLTDPRTFPVVFSTVGPGTGHQLFNDDYSNVEPRIGFSWDPFRDGKTAIRASFGIFHDRIFGNLFGNARGNPPFEQDYSTFVLDTIGNAFDTGGFPLATPDQIPSASVPDGALLAPVIFDTHFRNPVTNSYFFGIQRNLPAGLVLDVSYVGNNSHHVFRVFDANPPDPVRVAALVAFCSDPNNEFGCVPGQVSSLRLYSGADQGILPFNGVAHNAIGRNTFSAALNKSDGNANYNALQTKITKRFTRGFQMQGSYTWAHSIDDANDPIVAGTGQVNFVRDALLPALDRGNSDHDIRHVGVINSVWELPLGAGRTHWNQGVMGRVLEGFEMTGILTMQTGHPFDVIGTRDSQRVGRVSRGDVIGDPFAGGGTFSPGTKVFFSNNRAAFTSPAFDTFPTIGRNFFHGPSFVNLDMSVSKKMKIWEKTSIELRLEAYNLLNHANFNNPGDDPGLVGNQVGSAFFGQILSQLGRPDGTTGARQLQMAAKFVF